jgi:hypothetical protein
MLRNPEETAKESFYQADSKGDENHERKLRKNHSWGYQ